MASSQYDHEVKLVLSGNSGTGKTSILQMFADDKSTIGQHSVRSDTTALTLLCSFTIYRSGLQDKSAPNRRTECCCTNMVHLNYSTESQGCVHSLILFLHLVSRDTPGQRSLMSNFSAYYRTANVGHIESDRRSLRESRK